METKRAGSVLVIVGLVRNFVGTVCVMVTNRVIVVRPIAGCVIHFRVIRL
jgi:hypothetical protein